MTISRLVCLHNTVQRVNKPVECNGGIESTRILAPPEGLPPRCVHNSDVAETDIIVRLVCSLDTEGTSMHV